MKPPMMIPASAPSGAGFETDGGDELVTGGAKLMALFATGIMFTNTHEATV
jgi:hypothetical protein